ncbi:uncharacterized protein PAC_03596 [Phialocephala subalpina]|uniref:RNase H type-1 domain-containing protein n=1 Tax=Phialocephala subalpina TaxID=576137 RepID=A0A1L7WLR8_9HELO|nr:uncharacterized protein PAC_03596 [Phialocephala subalpina]
MEDRVFNQREYTYEKLRFSLMCDPATGVQQIPGYENTIVVDIGGATTTFGKKGTQPKGAYAILFGPESSYNSAKLLPYKYQPNVQVNTSSSSMASNLHKENLTARQLLPLYATLLSLRDILPSITLIPPPKRIVFKITTYGEAQGFFEHITDSVYTWASYERNWKNSKGRNVAFELQYRELHELILAMAEKGVEVKFWAVDKHKNKAVEDMAKRVLGVSCD